MWHPGCPNNACPAVEVPKSDIRVRKAFAIACDNGWPFVVHIEFGSLSGGRRDLFYRDLDAMLDEHPDQPLALIRIDSYLPWITYGEGRIGRTSSTMARSRFGLMRCQNCRKRSRMLSHMAMPNGYGSFRSAIESIRAICEPA